MTGEAIAAEWRAVEIDFAAEYGIVDVFGTFNGTPVGWRKFLTLAAAGPRLAAAITRHRPPTRDDMHAALDAVTGNQTPGTRRVVNFDEWKDSR